MNLKDLARLLDLSPTTVSRAINGYPEVSQRTRDRVRAAAERHGYAPNLLARRLATGRTSAIGHVVASDGSETVNPLFADFIAGAGGVYADLGYDMTLSFVSRDDEASTYRRMIAQSQVDGFILHGPREEEARIALLREAGVPFVVHGRDGAPEAPYNWLDMNNRRAFRRATDLLLDLGHRRIALINGRPDQSFAIRRRAGFEDAFAARERAADPDLIFMGEMIEPNGHAFAARVLEGPDPPTAILTGSIMLAMGAHRAIREYGLRLGRDVSVVTHDDDMSFLPNAGAVPLFTATRSPIRAAGARCAEILIDQIKSPGAEPCQELWEADLTLGRSTGPAP